MRNRKPIRALANARDLVEVLAEIGPLTPAEIAARIGVPRPTVYRLIEGTNAIDLTEPLPDSRVGLSLRWLHLADSARSAMKEWSNARAVLSDLVDRTGQTAFLTVLRDDSAFCIDRVAGSGVGVLILRPGVALPLHVGAAGRLLLALAADADSYLARAPFQAMTARTLTSEAELRNDIATTRAHGFTLSDQDATEGIAALGVSIMGKSGQVVGCVSIAGIAETIRSQRDALLDTLQIASPELWSGT